MGPGQLFLKLVGQRVHAAVGIDVARLGSA